jgi:hypothetical protein
VPLVFFVLAGVVSAVVTTTYRYQRTWTSLEGRYLWTYLRSGLALTSTGTYDMLELTDHTGRRLAGDGDVVLVTVGTADPVFALTDAAQQAGLTQLAWQTEAYPHAALHRWLGAVIYGDQSLLDLALPALWAAIAICLGMVVGIMAQRVVMARASPRWPSPQPAIWNGPTIVTVPYAEDEPIGVRDRAQPARSAAQTALGPAHVAPGVATRTTTLTSSEPSMADVAGRPSHYFR